MDSFTVTFHAPGIPAPQGSHKAFYNAKLGRAIVTQDNAKTRPWRDVVRWHAVEAMQGRPMATAGWVAITARYVFPRPKNHYRSGRHASELRPDAPYQHTTRPDADKLLRATLDALTGTVWRDDSMVAEIAAVKVYAGPGVATGLYCEIRAHQTKGGAS